MEEFWRLAQQAALRVWRQGGALRCEPNAAALQWAREQGLDEHEQSPQWQNLAVRVLAAADAGARRWRLGEDGPAFMGQAIVAGDGALLWWLPATSAPDDHRLERTLKLAGVSLWRIDTEAQWMTFDPRSADPISVVPPPEGMSLAAVRERIHPDDLEQVRQAAAAALAGDRHVDVVTRYLQADGSWRPTLTRRVAQRDAQGRPLGLLGISLDISILVAERERMLSVAEAAGLGLWNRDAEDGRVEWNQTMYRLHHRNPADGPPDLEHWWTHHVHPLDQARLRREQAQAERLWTPSVHTEFRIPTPDGGLRWIYSWTRRELRDGRRLAFGLHLDVSDRRGVESALQEERERALFALSAAGVGVWRRLGPERAYWNEAMYRLRGLEPDDPRPIPELAQVCLHPEDRASWAQISERYAGAGHSEETNEWEFRVVWPDGSVHWLVSRGRSICDEQGRPLYMTGINVDVTERHQAQAVALEGQRLAQLKRTQSEFLARVSHELRTPMNAVLGFSQLMVYDASDPLSERQAERLRRIESAGRHLLALIDDVLDLARIDVDRQPLADEPVSLDVLARESMDWVDEQARAAGIRLRLARPLVAGRVRADPRRLGQVLINLLTNAIKYNRPQGWVEVGSLARGQAEDGEGPAEWALVVRDSGRGLKPEAQQRIFEPFNRLGAELEGIAGTGIGLAIVRQLTERMGGSIELLSEVGVGSEFRIWLPADQEATRAAPLDELPALVRTAAPTPAGSEQLRLLCIEDNLTNQLLVRELLALRPAVALSCADNGRAGIAQALLLRPDVVLLDMQLPDLHGSEVLRALRRSPELAHCVIIALSANAMPSDVEAARALGFDDYWTKPIEVARFLRGIDRLLAAH
jgi:PAS domain S-box-containing protein